VATVVTTNVSASFFLQHTGAGGFFAFEGSQTDEFSAPNDHQPVKKSRKTVAK
jgi:hypothetical protein